jgi:hypothetical protein
MVENWLTNMAETYEDLSQLTATGLVPYTYFERMRLNDRYHRYKNRYFYQRGVTDGNYAITSATFADIDATNLACTLVTTGNPVRIKLFVGNATISAGFGAFQLLYDALPILGGNDMLRFPTGSTGQFINFEWVIPALAGSHDYKMQFRSNSGSNTFTLVDDQGIWWEVCEQ